MKDNRRLSPPRQADIHIRATSFVKIVCTLCDHVGLLLVHSLSLLGKRSREIKIVKYPNANFFGTPCTSKHPFTYFLHVNLTQKLSQEARVIIGTFH